MYGEGALRHTTGLAYYPALNIYLTNLQESTFSSSPNVLEMSSITPTRKALPIGYRIQRASSPEPGLRKLKSFSLSDIVRRMHLSKHR